VRWFNDHPASVGESYTGHLRFAFRFGGSMVIGGLACMVHGLLPFCLTTSGSRRVRALHAMLVRHPSRGIEPSGLDAFNWSI
jgi:hypothetical protein